MSKIYNDSNIFCPRHDRDNHINNIDLNAVYSIADLYFCPSCQFHKSPENCDYNIESKFCSNCLTDYSQAPNDQTTCTKNCFRCPDCTSLLQISVSDHTVGEKSGKAFKFECVYCEYSYNTRVVTSPKSLHAILKGEIKRNTDVSDTDNANLDLFNQLYDQLVSPDHAVSASERELENLTLSKIHTSKSSSNVDKNTQEVHDRALLRSATRRKTYQLPQSIRLTFKKSLRCLTCNYYLVLPKKEEGPPTINKFMVKFNAVDYMPIIKLSLPMSKNGLGAPEDVPTRVFTIGEQYNFLINFISPLNQNLEVKVSTLPSIPDYFLNPRKPYHISLTLATPTFTIKSDPLLAKTPIKSIPTPFLTSATTVSRSELVLRLGNSLLKKDPSYDYNNVENLETLAASGNNWYLIPINLLIEEGEESPPVGQCHVRVPIYVTVRTHLPDTIKKLGLSKKELSYGFWNVLDFGKYEVRKPEDKEE